MSKGNWQDIKFTDFSGGLNTKIYSNLINDNESPDLLNVIFDGKGSIAPRLGNALFGTASSATGNVRRTWVTQNVRDEEIPIRQVDNATTSWIEYYNPQTADWEILDDGITTGLDLGNAFYDYYTYFCSQKQNQKRWNGICWSTSTYADSAYARVLLNTSAASALGFLSAGSVVLDGEEVYYSSINGTALSGITFTTSHNGGLPIAQLPTSAGEVPAPDGGWVSASSASPKGSIMYEMDAQMFVTGASGVSGNVVYYSAVNEPTNYTLSAKPGGGGTARYPETVGSIKAVTDFDGVLTVLKENTIRKLAFISLADGTAGSLEIVERNQVVTSPKIGAVNSKGLNNSANDVTYVTPSGWVKSLTKVSSNAKSYELSINIRPTVEGFNSDDCASIYFAGKFYVATKSSSSATVNDTVLVYDTSFASWTRFRGWFVKDWFIYNNELYYGASNQIATYKCNVNYADNGFAYETYWNSKLFDYGTPNEQKQLGMIYIEGYVLPNTSIGVSAYFNGSTAGAVPKSIDGNNSDYVSPTESITSLGYNTWGNTNYGGSVGSTFTLKKFRWWGRYAGTNFYNLQVKIGTNVEGSAYRITHIIPYLNKVNGKNIPINKLK